MVYTLIISTFATDKYNNYKYQQLKTYNYDYD